jgi:ribosomal protein L37AE/L43A
VAGSIESFAGGRLTRHRDGGITFDGRVGIDILEQVKEVIRRLEDEHQCMYCRTLQPKADLKRYGDFFACADMMRCPHRPQR